MTNPQFDEVRERAAEALVEGEDVSSAYVGLLHDDGRNEYYFGNDAEDAAELREAAANQLGMLVRVLAAQSEMDVEDVADLGAERARDLDLR